MKTAEESGKPGTTLDDFLAELTQAAYQVALAHGVCGSFLEVELDIWRALREVVHRDQRWSRMLGVHVPLKQSREGFLAQLTDAVYRAILKHGFRGSFVDVELGLWSALRRTMRRDVFDQRLSGFFLVGQRTKHYEPWSGDAARA